LPRNPHRVPSAGEPSRLPGEGYRVTCEG
jgi:hypothetical protein